MPEVDVAVCRFSCQTEDCQLSVYYARTELGYSKLSRQPFIRHGRYSCIIEGASEGKGLGLRFLRHIERNSLLLFMVPADADDIKKEYEILLGELVKYNPDLQDKAVSWLSPRAICWMKS